MRSALAPTSLEMTPTCKSVDEFASFVKRLQRKGNVVVSVIAGTPADPVNARYETAMTDGIGASALLDVTPICKSSSASAAPVLRLQAFAEAFGENGSLESICNDDDRPALVRIGRRLASIVRGGCLAGAPVDGDAKTPGM